MTAAQASARPGATRLTCFWQPLHRCCLSWSCPEGQVQEGWALRVEQALHRLPRWKQPLQQPCLLCGADRETRKRQASSPAELCGDLFSERVQRVSQAVVGSVHAGDRGSTRAGVLSVAHHVTLTNNLAVVLKNEAERRRARLEPVLTLEKLGQTFECADVLGRKVEWRAVGVEPQARRLFRQLDSELFGKQRPWGRSERKPVGSRPAQVA